MQIIPKKYKYNLKYIGRIKERRGNLRNRSRGPITRQSEFQKERTETIKTGKSSKK